MGTDNNGLNSFSALADKLNRMREEGSSTSAPHHKGPRTKKITDEGRWTKLSAPEPVRAEVKEWSKVSYTDLPQAMMGRDIPVRLFAGEWKGKLQWQGKYRLYHNGKPSDYMDVVVNVTRFSESRPYDGGWFWVHAKTMAPKARVVFAELIRQVNEERDFGPNKPARRDSFLPEVLFQADVKETSLDDYWQVMRDYEAEVRYNSEPPDYDDY